MQPLVVSAGVIVSAGQVVAIEPGPATITHIDCAVDAAMIGHAEPPLADHVMAPELARKLVDEHFRHALELGVPLIEAGGVGFPGRLRPEALGDSAEAGLGRYFAESYGLRNDLFKMERGEPDRSDKDMDKRFAALRDWYRLRAAVMQGDYDVKGCAELLEAAQ